MLQIYNSGDVFDPYTMTRDDVHFVDIRSGLENTIRFAGQLGPMATVERHTLLVASLVRQDKNITDSLRTEAVLHALMHDTAEAYTGEVPRAIKTRLKNFKEIENNILSTIYKALNIPKIQDPRIDDYIGRADKLSVVYEISYYLNDSRHLWRIERLDGYTFPSYDHAAHMIERTTDFSWEGALEDTCDRLGVHLRKP